MSTFYVLPPRPQLGERFASFLEALFPGLRWPSRSWVELAEVLQAAVVARPGVYVVFRDEVESGDVDPQLVECFGAEPGDEVVEVSLHRGDASRRKLAAPAGAAGDSACSESLARL